MSNQTHPYGYWTDDRIIEESKKYKTKIEFKVNAPTAYKKANEKKLIKVMTWLKTDRHKKRGPRANHKYSKDVIISIIQEHACITYADFRRVNEYAYNQAKKYDWLPELGLIKSNPGKEFWTEGKVMEVAHNYSNKKDFEYKAKGAFIKAMANGWLPEKTWLKPLPLGKISKWTKEAIIEESKKYSSRTEFAINSPTAYQHACKDKTIFKEMPWIKEKKKPDGYWDVKEHVMEEGKKYRNRKAFSEGAYTAWKKAKIYGWIDEIEWVKD